MVIRPVDAQSILIGLSKIPVPRPLTHDLFIAHLEKTKMRIRRIEITGYKDDMFYARIIIKVKRFRYIALDARPSDALGLAARTRCAIIIDKRVLDETSLPASIIKISTGDLTDNEDDALHHLVTDLQQAVDSEDYEEAARIRDKIHRLH